MKKLLIVLIGLFVSFCGLSQACLPEGITFITQNQIDSFQVNYANCTRIEGKISIYGGNDITNLNGLSVVTSIEGNLYIAYHVALTSLAGLENLTNIGGDVTLQSNPALTNLNGLSNVISIGKDLTINDNNSLTNLSGLEGLTLINGNLGIYSNLGMTSLMGLENVTLIAGDLRIGINDNITNLVGLGALSIINGSLIIDSEEALASLTGLEGLTSVEGDITIVATEGLTSLIGLENLSSVGRDIEIISNEALTSLMGIEKIDTGSIRDLHIYNNHLLSACEVQSICDYLKNPNGAIDIFENAIGCNNQAEVEAACAVGIDESLASDDQFSIFPNPSSTQITIEITELQHQSQLTIFNLNGQELMKQQITEPTTEIDISHLTEGIYFLRFTNANDVRMLKVVKY